MDEKKLEKVREYLRSQFPGCTIEEGNDFPLRAQCFKIAQSDGVLLLKVGEIFIRDNPTEGISRLLEQWNVSELLKQNSTQDLLLTSDGPQLFIRD
jgi:hypothetical protein